jgi:hypothetical protein
MLFWYVRHSGRSQSHTMARAGRPAAHKGESATRADWPPSSLLRR